MIEFKRSGDRPSETRLEAHIRVGKPIGNVFAFFADPGNLEAITPPWLRFRIRTPPPIEMRAGTLIDYRLRLHCIPMRWRTEISVWEPPFRFVDRQLRGPYDLWEHTHTFTECAGGTLVSDSVRYRVPGGRLVETLFVERDLRRIFQYRRDRLGELLGAIDEASPEAVEQK